MNDLYKNFAYDYDEFGPIEEYLGKEKDFFSGLFAEHGVQAYLRNMESHPSWTARAEQVSIF